jgi:hypothetical protein
MAHAQDPALVQARSEPSTAQADAGGGSATAVWERLRPHMQPPAEWAGQFGDYTSLLYFEDGQPVSTASDWSRRREELRQLWNAYLGPWPAVIETPRVEVLHTSRDGEFEQRRVRVEIAPGQTGEGWLLVPPGNAPRPAALVVYYEPETSAGMNAEKEYRDFGRQLARRGFVTLSIGTPGGDARQPDIGQAVCQPLSFHAYVAANCYEALAGMPEVDAARVGVVGHSYGGKWSMFAGALYDKFAAVAVSDPGIVFDESRSNVNYWEPWYLGLKAQPPQRKPGIPGSDNPRTGAYEKLLEHGRDLHEIHALIAPRPFFVSGGSEDPPERWQALNRSLEVNQLLGVPYRIGMTNRPDHSPNAESNAVLIDFFVHFLGTPGNAVVPADVGAAGSAAAPNCR